MEKIRFIRFLQSYSKSNLIIVEGKKDKEILKELDISNVYAIYEIRKINTKKFREVLILTDIDKKGKKIYKFLYNYFLSEGLIINEFLRKKFFRLFKVIRVEELKKYIENLKYLLNYELGRIL